MMDLSLWKILDELKSSKYQWIDLSYEVTAETHHYEGFNDMTINEVFSFDKHSVCSREYTLVSQYGTHIDPPFHFVENGRALHEIGVMEFAFPLCVIDVSDKVKNNHDYGLGVEDILEWEHRYGDIPRGSFVAMRSDWSKRNTPYFYNKDDNGDCHYPGWTQPALQYLCEKRNIGAIGHETPDTDPAVTQKTALWAGELYYLRQDRFQVEMLKNLDLLPAKGAIIFCTFPNVKDAPGFTARCFAITPQ